MCMTNTELLHTLREHLLNDCFPDSNRVVHAVCVIEKVVNKSILLATYMSAVMGRFKVAG
jgi:hypothetical protein